MGILETSKANVKANAKTKDTQYKNEATLLKTHQKNAGQSKTQMTR